MNISILQRIENVRKKLFIIMKVDNLIFVTLNWDYVSLCFCKKKSNVKPSCPPKVYAINEVNGFLAYNETTKRSNRKTIEAYISTSY